MIGCSNNFLGLLLTKAPHLRIAAIEANRELSELCGKRLPQADIRCGDATDPLVLGDALADVVPDVVLARYLLQHLSPIARVRLLETVRAGLGASRRLICVDTDDTLFLVDDIIVKQHDGSIEVDTLPGEFTEVRVILPRTATFITDIRGRT